MTAVANLQKVASEVKGKFIERDEVIDLLALSVIAGSNMLMIGPPGSAKSQVFGGFFARLEGRHFYKLLTKGSIPDALLGPVSIRAMKEDDVFRHNTTGMLPDAEWAFIDEVFKGNSLTRNAILQILNEHQVDNGGVMQECPLIMTGAASNEYPEFHEDGAFYDRFLVRYETRFVSSHARRMDMAKLSMARDSRGFAKPNPSVSLDDVRFLHSERRKVTIPPETDALLGVLYGNLANLGVDAQIGDRRFADSLVLAASSAVMHERDQMLPDDLMVFQHTGWKSPEIRRDVQSAVMKTINPELADITDLYDSLEQGFEEFQKKAQESDEKHDLKIRMDAHVLFSQLAQHGVERMGEIVTKIHKEGRDPSRAKELLQKAKAHVAEAQRMAIDTSKTFSV